MKIAHLSKSDRNGGGASIAAYRLNEAFNRYGCNSKMYVLERRNANNTVFLATGLFGRIKNKVQDIIFSKLKQ